MQPKAYRLEAYLPERLVDEGFSWRTLARLLLGKLARKLTRGRVAPQWPESVVAYYGQIAVFDKPDHHMGGLAFGRDFPRVLNELGIGRRGQMFEFCAGPGYIGYSLLAAGWCESLVLADIDPDSVSTARFTAAHNELEDRVVVYRSDALEQIPDSERWDLVVANPPHFSERNADIRIFDPGWELHRRFYASVASHMNPGGLVVMAENPGRLGPRAVRGDDPRQQEAASWRSPPEPTFHGRPNGIYYQLSEWPGLQGPMTGARVSDQHARAVPRAPAGVARRAAAPRRRAVRASRSRQPAHRQALRRRSPAPVDLVAHAAVACVDRQRDHAARTDHQRRDRSPVGGQRRHRHPLDARHKDRSARRHRVGARADRRGDHQPVAGNLRVEDVVDDDGYEQLAGPSRITVRSLMAISTRSPAPATSTPGTSPRSSCPP